MPRGQYDRAAAKARREMPSLARMVTEDVHAKTRPTGETVLVRAPKQFTVASAPRDYPSIEQQMADAELLSCAPPSDFVPVQQFARPAYPYVNDPVPELQAKLDAANALIERYKDLVKRNGLWLDE